MTFMWIEEELLKYDCNCSPVAAHKFVKDGIKSVAGELLYNFLSYQYMIFALDSKHH